MKKKIIAIALCAALAVGGVVAGSLAFLQDYTEDVVNTFTVGDVDIDLFEHKIDEAGKNTEEKATNGVEYQLIPGTVYDKDPVVTVKAKSEECYLFVKITKENDPDTYLTYTLNTTDWTQYTNDDSDENTLVYYRVVSAEDAKKGVQYNLITGDKITVKDTLGRTDFEKITNTTLPKLTFKAAAVQKANVADENAAWDLVKKDLGYTTPTT